MHKSAARALLVVGALFLSSPQLGAQEGYSSDSGTFIPVPPSAFETPRSTAPSVQAFKAQEEFADQILDTLSRGAALECVSAHCRDIEEEFRIRLLKHRIWALNHNEKAHQWQWRSGRRIFYSVFVIVTFGLVLSLLQFIPAWRRDLKGAKDVYPQTEVAISEKSLKVSSPVIGVIILALSLGFFVAYLKMVYPLSYANASNADMTTEQK